MHRVMCALAGIGLVGCSTGLPIPVADFDGNASYVNAVNAFDGLTAFTTVEGAKGAFKAYFILYRAQATEKRKLAQSTSEFSFYSALGAAIAGIAKSPTGAIAGAAGSAGASIFSERYKLALQAANYDLAASAMRCMQSETSVFTPGALAALSFTRANGTVVSAEVELRDIAAKNFLSVQDRLYKLQSTFELAAPDFNKLRAIGDKRADNVSLARLAAPVRPFKPTDAAIAADATLTSIYQQKLQVFDNETREFNSLRAQMNEQKPLAEAYRTRMEICSASMTG